MPPRLTRLLPPAVILCLLILVSTWIAASGQTSSEALELGKRLYAENCVVCHGANGEGRQGATLAKDWPAIRPDLTIRTIIANGVPGTAMPAWSQANQAQSVGGQLSEAEIDALVVYILSWGNAQAPPVAPSQAIASQPQVTTAPVGEGDPQGGAALFEDNCVQCHGLEGEGYIGKTLSQNWASVWPDQTIRTIIQTGVPGTVMPAWSQAYGGPLSEGDIDDLVAYILVLGEKEPAVQASPTVVVAGSDDPNSPLRGWMGVAVTLALFVMIVAAILLLQRRSNISKKLI